MATFFVEGGNHLEGSVSPSGSKDSAVKLIIASTFCNEDVVLENIPKTSEVNVLLSVIESMGGRVTWIGDNKVLLNASSISTYEIPFELGSQTRFTSLLAGPLMYRFRKAVLPKPLNSKYRATPINRWVDTWESMNIQVIEDDKFIYLESENILGSNINFKISTHTGTANALLTAVFAEGESIINNAAEESEVDDLIDFLNTIGANVERIEPRKIKVQGQNVFSGSYFEIQPDINEAVAFATAAIITRGNISIKGIKKLQLTSFVNFLTKIGARFDYSRDELNVWYGGEALESKNIESMPAPGFLADWLPYAAVILNYAHGTSYIHDTIYVDRMDFILDLNRMGARMESLKPSEAGFSATISDERYDFGKFGEPNSAVRIIGPNKLKGVRLNMDDPRFDSALVIAALGAEGKSELIDVTEMFVRYERFFEKLVNLGAKITQ